MKMRWFAIMALPLARMTGSGEPEMATPQQREQAFAIQLNGSVAEVTPLFGPVGEAQWAPGWRPRFLHPSVAAQREGTIFKTRGENEAERVWILTEYDENRGRVQYVVFTPGSTLNQIKIHVVAEGQNRSRATITYRHSALIPAANPEEKLDADWAKHQQAHWEAAINRALDKKEKR